LTSLKGAGVANQDLDQQRFAEGDGWRFSADCVGPTFAQDVQRAFWLARTRRMPVLLSCPVDIQEADVVGAFAYVPSSARIAVLPPPRPDQHRSKKAGDILASVAGRSSCRRGRTRVRGRKGDRELGRAGRRGVRHNALGKGHPDDRWSVGSSAGSHGCAIR